MARPAYSLAVPQPRTLMFTALCGAALTTFAAKTGFIQARMPANGKIIGMTLNVNQRGGTHSASALDVKAGGTSLLGTPFDVDALTPGTPVDKENSALAAGAAAVAKDVLITVDTTESGGTSPTWADVTLQIDWVPIGS